MSSAACRPHHPLPAVAVPCAQRIIRVGVIAALTLLALQPSSSRAQGLPPGQFSIYCTSNLDGTGRCKRDDSGERIGCIMIPGGVIACRDKAKRKYECVQYGAVVLGSQSQFVCLPDSGNAISDHLFDVNTDTPAIPKDSPSAPSPPPTTAPPQPEPRPALPAPSGWAPQPPSDSEPNTFRRAF